jgi:hypothetical protein
MSSNYLRREAMSSTSRLTLHRVWAELQRAAAENPIFPKPPTATERAIPRPKTARRQIERPKPVRQQPDNPGKAMP